MKKAIKIGISGGVALSLLLNIFFITFDGIIPSITSRIFKPEYFSDTSKPALIENSILEAGYRMMQSDNLRMPWQTDADFLRRLNKAYIASKNAVKLYYYPKAYLSLGLIEYALYKEDLELLLNIKGYFDEYYVDEYGAKFEINKVDQVPIGLAAIILYNHYKEDKYRLFAHQTYKFIRSQIVSIDDFDIVNYRFNHDSVFYVDVVGMIVPFLIKYGEYFNEEDSIKLAKSEIMFFIRHGIDKDTYLPFHTINLNTMEAYGPNNWGRGIGWFILGLESLYNYNKKNDLKNKELNNFVTGFKNSIYKLSMDGTYTQFPGTSKRFDSSSTLMILYGLNKISNNDNKASQLKNLSKYIRSTGEIDFCSGDTYAVNLYSRQFGISELSQGLLLMLLSH